LRSLCKITIIQVESCFILGVCNNMLIGCCMNLLARGNDRIGIEQVEMIAKTGYDYIELPMVPMMDLSEGDFDALCERVRRAGIPCRSCSNLLPGKVRVTGSDVDYDQVRTYLKEAAARARKLGAKIVVFGSPAARNVEGDFPRELAMVQFVKALQIMDEYADDELQFVIEHVCRLEGNLVYTVKENCMVLDICRTKHIGVLADTYHMAVEEEPLENLKLAGKNLLHTHIANPNKRVYPAIGDGVDYQAFMDTLKSIGYTGGVSVEAFTQDPANDARRALEALRAADA